MTKAQRHKAEASRSYREADRLQGMAFTADTRGEHTSAALLRHAAHQRRSVAANHEQAFAKELAA